MAGDGDRRDDLRPVVKTGAATAGAEISAVSPRLAADRHARRRRPRAAHPVRVRGGADGRADAEPDVIVLDDPTRGVDVGARAEMHRIVRDLAAAGKTTLITSTDLTELVDLCHRVLVFQHGRITAEIGAEALSEQALSVAMNAGFVAMSGADGRPAS